MNRAASRESAIDEVIVVESVGSAEVAEKEPRHQVTVRQAFSGRALREPIPALRSTDIQSWDERSPNNLRTAATPTRIADAHIYIGSVSKLFVGYLTLKLADQGLLSLDDPLSAYLPNHPNADKITIRMLGHHRSGLADILRDTDFRQQVISDPTRCWKIDELISVSRRQTPAGSPGGGRRYANINSILLARVAEIATKTEFAELLRQHILDPWQLSQTGIVVKHLPVPHTLAFRHAKKDRWFSYGKQLINVTHSNPTWAGPAGFLYSTLHDLRVCVPKLVTGAGLEASIRTELLRWHEGDGQTRHGFHLDCVDGWLGHSGDVPGFNTSVWYHPEYQVSVIAWANLSNLADGSMPAEVAASRLRARYPPKP
ncbi:MAG: serine hydrolase domain-containing protein [Planctomycetota bacterium]